MLYLCYSGRFFVACASTQQSCQRTRGGAKRHTLPRRLGQAGAELPAIAASGETETDKYRRRYACGPTVIVSVPTTVNPVAGI